MMPLENKGSHTCIELIQTHCIFKNIFLLVAVNIELFIEKEIMGQETWRFMLKY